MKKIFLCLSLLGIVIIFSGCRAVQTTVAPTHSEQLISHDFVVQNAEIIMEQLVQLDVTNSVFRIYDKKNNVICYVHSNQGGIACIAK